MAGVTTWRMPVITSSQLCRSVDEARESAAASAVQGGSGVKDIDPDKGERKAVCAAVQAKRAVKRRGGEEWQQILHSPSLELQDEQMGTARRSWGEQGPKGREGGEKKKSKKGQGRCG